MTRQEYIKKLGKNLNKLPKFEWERIMQYYNEYFDEAGEENEQQVIEELGDPDGVAKQVINDMAYKYVSEPANSVKSVFSKVWMVVLWICAAPIALPFAFVGVFLLVALVLIVFMLILSLIMVGVAMLICGLISVVCGVIIIFTQFSNGLCILGAGLICLGLSIPFGYFIIFLGQQLFSSILRTSKKFIKRRQPNEI